jgi:sugar/nucleoside kinase (ribokinase family)
MSILVVGSIALDSVETPFGKVENSPGGSALHFSAAASLFAPVNLVGVVGEDFNLSLIGFLKEREVDLSGLMIEKGETFRWGGRYHANMIQRDTLYTYLNVFENFQPVIPAKYQKSKYIFLANIDPELQLRVLENIDSPVLTILDTMNFWISGKRTVLEEVIKRIDVIILNDDEIRELTGEYNIYVAAKKLLRQGPKILIIKKGEHGAILISEKDYFAITAYPVDKVVDPTGAGDAFAGGFVGYLASCQKLSQEIYRAAVVYGSVVASFNVEAFSFSKLKEIDRKNVDERFTNFRRMTNF